MANVKIGISQIVGGGICVAASDGNKVHDTIFSEMKKGNRITLSFSGITRMTTAFLNSAIGQLYGEFTEEEIRKQLAPPIDAEPWHLNRLKLVVDRAKVFFSNPSAARSVFLLSTGLDDE
jgi:Icc-related predicted phosphoesterase